MQRHGIKVANLTKDFKDVRALNKVSFTIEKPGLYGLIGPNAAGKTTLLKCISSLLVPTEGDV
ncbi:MAG: ATP-binding cassette domain-containing protein, partial [Candidatus Thorarchaeota archaeon]